MMYLGFLVYFAIIALLWFTVSYDKALERLGEIMFYLEDCERDRYVSYHSYYRRRKRYVIVRGEKYMLAEDIMLIGKLAESGYLEVVFYPSNGEPPVILITKEEEIIYGRD